ncbi:MAG: amidohydrolase [Kiritimatiellae bacterium]|nr:amidohydrolase [Kiritimatiellia bacterium]
MACLFRNLLLGTKTVDVSVENGTIAAIVPAASPDEGAAPRPVVPAFYNCHTHLAMNLLRGYADDLELMPWLQEHIWPAEAHLTDEIVYAGTRLAILEMIRSGTVFANDMYWHAPAVARAAEEMGIRCAVSMQTIETGGPGHNDPKNVAANKALAGLPRDASARVFATYAPHAIYTVCEQSFRDIAAKARDEDTFLHVHVAETRFEVETCKKEHGGRTPVAYLNDLGILGPKTVMAHCVHLTDDDIKIIADTGAVIVENQQSNMKLVSGLFPYRRAVERGTCRLALGTDGASSNNALSMFAEMKAAALCAKIESGDPTCAPAADVWRAATRGGAQAFGLDAGEIRAGAAADFVILRPDAVPLVPGFNRASDLVYAADPSCVDTVVCAGRVLMENGIVPGEAEIISAARRAAAQLTRAT